MELTIKKDVNPNDFGFYDGNDGSYYVTHEGILIVKLISKEYKDIFVSLLSMAKAYYNFANKETNVDDLRDVL